mmetsp:Transcript_13856/g.18088  ORF Transcript_13856/g.18088 Transcript_13856/m.18088 type:complete len:225 (+) Transcript_13856:104-778(+)|eukprot:CAMPEP_0198142834 /NCGR_PEP_ID=MMETSP1443-20131203/5516_1 /TAXON_ID=186043 /ORGANISM="Entomoneis sp., Strain CCMP2396" /LENGTH=224 /DNA_ID=CAMNT_0043805933 /DNA_START=116 /DNA_END=790 /DNA_ORIENTATION=+
MAILKFLFSARTMLLLLNAKLCLSRQIRGASSEFTDFERVLYLDPARCELYPECQGLAGSCCPATDGTQLGCCSGPGSCESTPACAAEGLEGHCCPSLSGDDLDCCTNSTPSPTTAPTESPIDDSTCSSQPVCAGLGLIGDCCPTKNGIILDCCDPEPQCYLNPACAASPYMNDDDNCCPNDQGQFEPCCAEADPSCSAYSGCQGLAESCCPNAEGVRLACCDE